MAVTTSLTSNTLIESIKRKGSIPDAQNTFVDQDFLDFANEELWLALVPFVMSLHEDFFLYEEQTPVVLNVNSYEIPSRAMGNKLRDLQVRLNNNGTYAELTRVGIGDRFDEYNGTTQTNLSRFYIKNNTINFLTPITSTPSGDLTFIYYMRPSALVEESRVGIITKNGVNIGATEVTIQLENIPDNFDSNLTFDIYKGQSPHNILKIDLATSNINTSTNTITFNKSDLQQINSVDGTIVPITGGDHVALSGECSIPQVPSELHPMLAQMVLCRVFEAQGDQAGLQAALLKLAQMEKAAGNIIDTRVDDTPIKIVSRHGLLRTSVFSKRFNRR